MAITLEPGTVVQLKSGGPKMTVIGEHDIMGVETGNVRCEWFDEKNKAASGSFAETSLKVINA